MNSETEKWTERLDKDGKVEIDLREGIGFCKVDALYLQSKKGVKGPLVCKKDPLGVVPDSGLLEVYLGKDDGVDKRKIYRMINPDGTPGALIFEEDPRAQAAGDGTEYRLCDPKKVNINGKDIAGSGGFIVGQLRKENEETRAVFEVHVSPETNTHRDAVIRDKASVEGVYIGKGCSVEDQAKISDCVLTDGTVIRGKVLVNHSKMINCRVEDKCFIDGVDVSGAKFCRDSTGIDLEGSHFVIKEHGDARNALLANTTVYSGGCVDGTGVESRIATRVESSMIWGHVKCGAKLIGVTVHPGSVVGEKTSVTGCEVGLAERLVDIEVEDKKTGRQSGRHVERYDRDGELYYELYESKEGEEIIEIEGETFVVISVELPSGKNFYPGAEGVLSFEALGKHKITPKSLEKLRR